MDTLKSFFLIITFAGLSVCKSSAQPSIGNQKIIITNFSAYEKNNRIIVDWATDGTIATNYWQVQASDDGIDFSTVALVLGPDPRKKGDRYEYKEMGKAVKEVGKYYRLRHIDQSGMEQVSEIIKPIKLSQDDAVPEPPLPNQ